LVAPSGQAVWGAGPGAHLGSGRAGHARPAADIPGGALPPGGGRVRPWFWPRRGSPLPGRWPRPRDRWC